MPTGNCGIVRAVMASLEHANCPATYDALMGLTGMAFMVPPLSERERSARLSELRIPQALAATGLRGQLVGVEGAEEIVGGVRAAIDASFAVPILGWPDDADEWAIIAGYDLGRGVLCGWPAGESGDTYIGAPVCGRAIVGISERRKAPARRQAALEALGWAGRLQTQVQDAYGRWRQLLDEGSGDDSEEPDSADGLARQEQLADDLADARMAAARFLRRCADMIGSITGQWLGEAAEHCSAVVELAEGRQGMPPDWAAADADTSRRWREEWRQRLDEIARQDALMLDTMRRSLTAETEPDEGTGL